MQSNWYRLEYLETLSSGRIYAKAVVPSDSPWFSGHFPGDPILPAIAQLGIVFDVIQQATGRQQNPESVNRVKYRRVIRPDEAIHVAAIPVEGKQGLYSFQITVNDETACKGRITAAQAAL
ncbi:MAG: hypothetical protein K9J85_03410 [Desulfobacteraceae bacterium]|nr:hypothetical protein [Desulfobacteraceae bacterium]